jgi:hypothetical protein
MHKGFTDTTQKPMTVPAFTFKPTQIPQSSGAAFGSQGTLLPATKFTKCEGESRQGWFKKASV